MKMLRKEEDVERIYYVSQIHVRKFWNFLKGFEIPGRSTLGTYYYRNIMIKFECPPGMRIGTRFRVFGSSEERIKEDMGKLNEESGFSLCEVSGERNFEYLQELRECLARSGQMTR